MEIRLKPLMLAEYDLPDILYPVSSADFDAALLADGHLPFAPILYQLQVRSRAGDADWQSLEPAMDRLAVLLAPIDPRPLLTTSGDDWWVEVGPVNLDGPIVTIQRGTQLICAISSTDGGRLRVASYRPLDAKSAGYITALSARPHAEHGVCMRENNWEYALDSSVSNGNFYAYMGAEAYLSYWANGIGFVSDGTQDMHWLAMRALPSRLPAVVVAELGVCYSLSDVQAKPG